MAKVRVLIALQGDPEAKRVSLEASIAKADGVEYQTQFAPQMAIPRVQIDPDFAPVPLESIGRTPVIAASSPQAANHHIVRGELNLSDMDSVSAIPNVSVFSDPTIGTFSNAGCAAAPIGSAADVAAKINSAGLHARGLNGRSVHIAIVDTGINIAHLKQVGISARIASNLVWTPPGVPVAAPGSHPVDHGTMCAHAALIAAPKATLIDVPLLQSQTPGGSVMSGFLSDGLSAFSAMRVWLTERKIRKLVVNNSWGMYQLAWDFPAGHPGRYADNPLHPFNIACAALSRAGADIYFAAGNCGPTCPDGRCDTTDSHSITGANAHPDVTTLAGVSVQNRLIGYSSQGPGIPGMAAQKPDFASYTHYLGSEAFGPGVPDSGTSTACPVAAGMCAALRSSAKAAVLRPLDLARELRIDAHQPGSTAGWNKRLGYGIMDAYKTAVRLNL
jgi:Subtilase family